MKTRTLNVKDLATDMSYQSPVKEGQVKKIVKNFDEGSIGTIYVNLRKDGTYYIIDGQHRVTALKRLGISTVKANVYEGLTVEEEAKKYRDFNTRPTKSPNSIAKADLKFGDEFAEMILFSVLEAGMDIDYDNQNQRHGYISAYRSLERIYKKYGSAGLTETIKFIKNTFGDDKPYFQGFILEGFAKFLATYYEKIDQKNLTERLRKTGFSDFMAEVNKQRPSFNSKKECLPFVVADIYNKRRSKNNKLNKIYLHD